MRKILGVVDPEPVIVTVEKEVPADIPDRFIEQCEDVELLLRGSTLGEMLRHSQKRYDANNECADKTDELRLWNEKDKERYESVIRESN